MKRIIIFASGSGSNAENIIQFFQKKQTAIVTKVVSNNSKAKIFERCKKLNIECLLFNKEEFLSEDFLEMLQENADYIVLAGFLWKIPEKIINVFSDKIVNIHPSLLPKYGGKGMYGMHVHNAVKKNNERETGITIHLVNKNYDEGAILFQATTQILKTDTPEIIAEKVHELEYKYFPETIEKLLL